MSINASGYDLEQRPRDAEPAAGSGESAPGKRALTDGLQRGRLEPSTRSQMESSFGVSFGHVNVHTDSPRASGSVQALTEGNDVHFAPGRYAPGTSGGNWLIAHELAHVVQQSGAAPSAQAFDVSEPSLTHEADADRAADAAVAGQRAQVKLSTRHGARQHYEAWEHRAAGDAGGGGRTITVNCGITLTYGQVVALSGDFYRSPEALMNAPRGELERILAVMDRERNEAAVGQGGRPTAAQINQNNADYEMATTGPGSRANHHNHDGENPLADDDHDHDHDGGPDADHPHGKVHQGEHVEDNGPQGGAPAGAEASFLDLADNNASHFSPENIELNFTPKHQIAIDLAKEAWHARNPGKTPGSGPAAPLPRSQQPVPAATPDTSATHAAPVPTGATAPDAHTVSTAGSSTDAGERKEAMAVLTDGFAAHFLTDAFASGHLVSGSTGRKIGAKFYSEHQGTVMAGLAACMAREYPAAMAVMPGGAMAVLGGMAALISSKAGSLTLKIIHDYFNAHGLEVKNKKGTLWRTVGDASLASSPVTMAQATLATTKSREGVDKVIREGQISDTERDEPLQYIPSEAKFAEGAFQPISSFCVDENIFNAVLTSEMMSADPATNRLWILIKGNVQPMIALKLRQGGRWVGDLATGAYETASNAVSTAGNAIVSGAKTVGNAVVEGAKTTGNAIVSGAKTVGNA
ncbi:MAG: DUF4157 domain-containing protein, partial [Deltaproteobacteria bacterium]|nr:DUF4157 domain-containing protein [Deltaproteobacteria bacterium]